MWDQARADAMADLVRSIRVRRHQVGSAVGGAPGWEPPEVGTAAADTDSHAAEVTRVIGDLTEMRRVMTDHADIRVVIGGALQPGRPGTRLAPGILEEAYLAAEAGRALLVAGGFGGAGALIADAILGRLDPRTVDDLAPHFVTPPVPGAASFAHMLLRFRSLGVLRNGLTDGENVELPRSSDVATVSSLILRSVHRIGAGRSL